MIDIGSRVVCIKGDDWNEKVCGFVITGEGPPVGSRWTVNWMRKRSANLRSYIGLAGWPEESMAFAVDYFRPVDDVDRLAELIATVKKPELVGSSRTYIPSVNGGGFYV